MEFEGREIHRHVDAVIENSKEGRDDHGHGYGSGETVLSDEDIEALKEGKTLAININGKEYVEFITHEDFITGESIYDAE